MSYLLLLLCLVLFATAIRCLWLAFGLNTRDGEGNAPLPPLSKRFSARWLGSTVLCLVGVVTVFIALFIPMRSVEDLEEVEALAREVCLWKEGEFPSSLRLQRVREQSRDEEWRYAGTARIRGEEWTVGVFRTSRYLADTGAAQTLYTLVPKKKEARAR